MAGSSRDESETDWIFYRDRDEWKDITPVQQDDGDPSIVAIAYSEKFKDVHDYFRAILQSGEKSERALGLTKDALDLNPANYTVWQYRREILKALGKDLMEEMVFTQNMVFENPKNYQVWHHCRVVAEWLNCGESELVVTEAVLKMDAKNYHAWQHRQWALKTFKLFDHELDYVDKLLQKDIRNNSAWNQRFFVLNNTNGFTPEVLRQEISYALEKIMIATNNESVWNYLRGLLLHEKSGLTENSTVTNFCEELYASGNRSPFLLALLVDMCEEKCSLDSPPRYGNYTLERAKELCHELSTKYDKIRAKYWDNVLENIVKKCSKSS